MKNTLLIADDDANILASLEFLLEEENYQVIKAQSPKDIFVQLSRHSVDLLITDMNFSRDTTSGQEGIELIEKVHQQEAELPIIVMTGWGSIDLAVASLQSGANDFIQKPWNDERLLSAIATQLARATAERQAEKYKQQSQLLTREQHAGSDDQIIAQSPMMKQLLQTMRELAQSDMNILLTGDNGTGKSLLANYIHQHSPRRAAPFVAVNMGAIPENLFESEMFGHVKGAFTDARDSRVGRFEMAESGTLFLDELANIPLNQQAKLLRVLEEHRYEPVGSSKTRQSDVRIVSATNAELNQLIENNEFRQDLYYRLNTVELRVPSLKERTADILPLTEFFLRQFSRKYHRDIPTLSEESKQQLLAYDWPGNIRELSHLMERAIFLSKQGVIEPDHLTITASATSGDYQAPNDLTLDQIEQRVLTERLAFYQGNVTETARSLGLSRSGYYRRIHKYGME